MKQALYLLGFALQLTCTVTFVLKLFVDKGIMPYYVSIILFLLGIVAMLLATVSRGEGGYQMNCFSVMLIIVNAFILFLTTVTAGLMSFGNLWNQ